MNEIWTATNAFYHFLSRFINSLRDCIQFTIWKCHLLQNKPAPWMTAGYLSICCLISCSRTSTTNRGRGHISRKWWNHLILALECTLGNNLIYHFQGVLLRYSYCETTTGILCLKKKKMEKFLQSLVKFRKIGILQWHVRNEIKW